MHCTPREVLVCEYRNREIVIDVRVTNPEIADLTDAKLHLSVANREAQTDAEALITKKSLNNGGSDAQAVVVSGEGKMIRFFIDAADTLAMTAGRYVIDATIIQAGKTQPEQLFDVHWFDLLEPVTLND